MISLTEFFQSPTRRIMFLLAGFILVFLLINALGSKTVQTELASATDSVDAILIPSIGLNTPIVYLDSEDPHGIVHQKGSAMPGEEGNAHFSGSINLPDVKLGDDVIVQRDAAVSLIFKVIDVKIVPSLDSSNNQGRGKFLTLETSYPFGGTSMHYVVVAELK